MNEEKPKKRSGETIVTSVSVSKRFHDLINEHNLSPTECFRRGIAVTLCDLGVGMYQSEKNEERSKYMHEFLRRYDSDVETKNKFKKIKMFDAINSNLKEIKKLVQDIESEQDSKDEKMKGGLTEWWKN